jgi:hypothetical protein
VSICDDGENRVLMIKHPSQVNVVFKGVALKPEEKKTPVGFNTELAL